MKTTIPNYHSLLEPKIQQALEEFTEEEYTCGYLARHSPQLYQLFSYLWNTKDQDNSLFFLSWESYCNFVNSYHARMLGFLFFIHWLDSLTNREIHAILTPNDHEPPRLLDFSTFYDFINS